jgi:hypothetical protein
MLDALAIRLTESPVAPEAQPAAVVDACQKAGATIKTIMTDSRRCDD